MSNAPARVTVTYRVQVTKTIHHTLADGSTLFQHNPPLVKTRLLPTKYKTLKAAQAKAAQYCHEDTEDMAIITSDEGAPLTYVDKTIVLYISTAVVISHTATTPLH